MTQRGKKKLSLEILGLLVITFLISVFLFQFLCFCSVYIADSVLSAQGIGLTDLQLVELDNQLFQLSLLAATGFFVVLFLFLLGERLSYLKEVFKGIEALQNGQQDYVIPLEGNNELTQLAQAVNYLSATQREVKEQERALVEEKEQLIRTLSHDIRTPLTSILAYSEYLAEHKTCTKAEQQEQLTLIRQKAGQIKELTDILLCGGKRNLERFEDARLLIEQLAEEFKEELEDEFRVLIKLEDSPFPGTFDVQELRRIFDNLISNVKKYADFQREVSLTICAETGKLVIEQCNFIRKSSQLHESYQMGLSSIRRIANNYAGQADVFQTDEIFQITITLSDI